MGEQFTTFAGLAMSVTKIAAVTVLGAAMLKVMDKKLHAQMIMFIGGSVVGIQVARYAIIKVAGVQELLSPITKTAGFLTKLLVH
jgi:hypothetical protein